MTSEEGRRVFERLVSVSDVLIENFRQGSLERLGYDYRALRRHRPNLIYVSMPAFGNTGPMEKDTWVTESGRSSYRGWPT